MTPDDLKRLSTSPTLLNLDRLIGPRIIKIVYLAGLAGIGLGAISHLFATFGASFGSGLWGLLEIAVYGVFAFLVLRLGCEAFIVYFRRNADLVDGQPAARRGASIIDDVREALSELAEDDPEPDPRFQSVPAPKTTPAPTATPAPTNRDGAELDAIAAATEAKSSAAKPAAKPAVKKTAAAKSSGPGPKSIRVATRAGLKSRTRAKPRPKKQV
ncbi:MAG: DUF4282 domain-containing protein [Alphaproteobacteria bacterium]|nr:DUF4282 domain-containing protein [Alphaproteobacteria bacterium]